MVAHATVSPKTEWTLEFQPRNANKKTRFVYCPVLTSLCCSLYFSCRVPLMQKVSSLLLKLSLWRKHGSHFLGFSTYLSLNREGRWGTTDDFATSFLQFPLFATALWDLPNSRSVHCLMLSSHLFLCLPCLFPPFTVPCKMALARPDGRET